MMIFFKMTLRAIIRKTCLFASCFFPSVPLRKKIREAGDSCVIKLFRKQIEAFVSDYPKVYSEEQSLERLIGSRKSIARFGDGEFKLIIGERHKSFQDVDEALNRRMLEVLRSSDPNVIVAIHPVRDFDSLGRIWQKFIIRIGVDVLALLDKDRAYDSTGLFHRLPTDDKTEFIDRVRLIKRLWSGRKVVIVVGEGSRFHFEDELFDNVESVDYVYGPSKNAFSEYERIMDEIRCFDKSSYLFLLVLGPTATVMAHELGCEGYQAIDFGQMPGKYIKARNYLFGAETALPLK